jgi:hypothetical protein
MVRGALHLDVPNATRGKANQQRPPRGGQIHRIGFYRASILAVPFHYEY